MPKFKKKQQAPDIMDPLTSEEAVTADADNSAQTAPDVATAAPEQLVEVWERRFNSPGPQSSKPIPLTVQGMVTRWINTAIEGRHHRAVYDQGWQPVPVKLLKDPASIPDLYKHPHRIVCRGERGKEVLMMMPKTVFEKIRKRKAELNTKALRDIRSEVASAAASRFGSEAGDFLSSGRSSDGNIKTVGNIQFGTERVPMGGD